MLFHWTRCTTPIGLSPLELTNNWEEATVPEVLIAHHDQDLWYQAVFGRPSATTLCFKGLATLAEVWLNGTKILESANMFREYRCEVAELLQEENTLLLVFRSFYGTKAKRPRPRWKTALVEEQNLRWWRTTLLGWIPGWTPKTVATGPWKEIVFEESLVKQKQLLPGLKGDRTGTLQLQLTLSDTVLQAELQVGSLVFPLELKEHRVETTLSLHDIQPWWPHTHGKPTLYACTLLLSTLEGTVELELGPVGFRRVTLNRSQGRVQLLINDQPIFCRGVCWTLAPLELDPDPEPVLKQAKKGGANMIRVGGTMVYAAEALLLACDREGVLLWQDFMFANMDYPFSDGAFFREVEAEVKGILEQHSQHPCIAVYCGNSEVEQQAAMLGFPASERQAPFFYQTLPEWLQKLHPGIPYVPSTPCEGALPFHTDQGLTHYYGVGAYRRPLSDIRAAEVKFTPECLGFSNVPDDKNLLLLGEKILPHHPVWKSGVPRDSGAGWDFEDIRDFYLKLLFGLDPIELRSTDFERYLALSRVVTGELMLRAYAEWRQSGCGGALIWFLKDLRPGAGWGILDSTGMPKPVWWFLKRAWARQAVLLTDEGLNGVGLCVYNETEEALEAVVELELLQEKRVGVASVPVKVGAFGRLTLSGEALLGNFGDLSYAYRFGPPRQRVVVGRLKIGEESVAEDALFPAGYSLKSHEIGALKARLEDGALVLESTVFVQHVSISCSSYLAEDNYFHLCPGVVKRVRLEGSGEARALKVELTALNLEGFLVLRG